MDWFRWYHGTASDPKLAGIARRLKLPRSTVIAVWAMVLESASSGTDRGKLKHDADDIGAALDLKTDLVGRVLQQMRAEEWHILDGQLVRSWDERQARCSRPSGAAWAALRSAVFERDDYTCRYCGARAGRLECDHVHPAARGGADHLDNLATACFACNRSKGSRDLADWQPQSRSS